MGRTRALSLSSFRLLGQPETFRYIRREYGWFTGHHLYMRFTGQVFAQDDSKVYCGLDFLKLVSSISVAGSDGLFSPGDSQ